MRVLRSGGVAAVAGALTWTAAEYALHRFAMHEMRGRGPIAAKHAEHHADTSEFAPVGRKFAAATATGAVMYPTLAVFTSRRRAAGFTGGFIAGYGGYEIAHRLVHSRPPRTQVGRRARKHHMHHHFGAPMRNHGVSNAVWDRVFGTYDEPETVTVPRRAAPAWLLDESGTVRPEFAGDYTVKGRR